MRHSMVLLAMSLPLVTVAPTASAADAVVRMCVERDPVDVCECAAESLRAEVGEADYALYEEVGDAYLARKAAGESMADAWMAAVGAAAAGRGESRTGLLGRTNEIGRAHRSATKACGG